MPQGGRHKLLSTWACPSSPYVPRADLYEGPGHRRGHVFGNFMDDPTVVLTSSVRGETNQKVGLLTLFLNHSQPFLVPGSFTFHIFLPVSKPFHAWAPLPTTGQCVAEHRDRGGPPLPLRCWPHKVKEGYRQTVNPNEHET